MEVKVATIPIKGKRTNMFFTMSSSSSATTNSNNNNISSGSTSSSSIAVKKTKKNAFTPEEDENLKLLVDKFGEDNWPAVANRMKKRNIRQCRERWNYYLSPLAVNGKWTREEDSLLIDKINLFGRKWKFLTQFFKGRTEVNIKNHWSLMKKKEKRLQKQKDDKVNISSQNNYSSPISNDSSPIISDNDSATNGISTNDYEEEGFEDFADVKQFDDFLSELRLSYSEFGFQGLIGGSAFKIIQ